MSIPERLWRVVKGHVSLAQEKSAGDRYAAVEEKIDARAAEAAAYRELSDALRVADLGEQSAPSTKSRPASPDRAIDPLQACYELLQVKPGVDLAGLEAAHQARLTELPVERYPAGSADRAVMESRRQAVGIAYDRLRDHLNPVETRFERLEF